MSSPTGDFPVLETITRHGHALIGLYPKESLGSDKASGWHVPFHLVPLDKADGKHELSEDCPCTPMIGMQVDEEHSNTYWVIRRGSARDSEYPLFEGI